MIDDPDAYASVAVRLRFVSYHCTPDGGGPVFPGSLEQLHDEAYSRAKLDATWQSQIKTGGAHVVEQTVEAERLIIDVYAPDSGGQCVVSTRLCPPLNHRMPKRFFNR